MAQSASVQTPITKIQCIVPGCKRVGSPKRRGLCMKCYAIARLAVKAGTTTWLKLQAEGKVLPAPDRKPRVVVNRKDTTKVARDWFGVQAVPAAPAAPTAQAVDAPTAGG